MRSPFAIRIFLLAGGCFGGLVFSALAEPAAHQHAKHHPTPAEDDSADSSSEATPIPDPKPTESPANKIAPDASLTSSQLKDFKKQPLPVQSLIEAALALTTQDLTYTYGSSDPVNGGMDCSGFIYHVLTEHGFDEVPRDASGQYVWVRKSGTFRAVVSRKEDSFELNEMRPGDLLFWTGTYDSKKDPPVTHTMIYLGREKGGNRRVMVGSSDGRTYHGKQRWGVSVFDFTMPGPSSREKGVTFIGYAHLPGIAAPVREANASR